MSWRSKPVPEPTTDTIGLTAIADLAPVLLIVGFALYECRRSNTAAASAILQFA
jgi:hypothetical protein